MKNKILHSIKFILSAPLIFISGVTQAQQNQDRYLNQTLDPLASINESLSGINGLVTPKYEAIISGELAARILFIAPELSIFLKNDSLLSLECKLYEAERDIVKSNLSIAEIEYNKNRELLSRRAIGENEALISKAEFEKAQSEYRITKINTNRCEIKAPFNGVVSEVLANQYEFVQKHQALLKIINLEEFLVQFLIPNESAMNYQPTQKLDIYIEELKESFLGKVQFIDQVIDPSSQTIKVIAVFNEHNPLITPGMTAIISWQ